ncbi:GNAT family protein [Treponema sp. HNW]|uniref:GNAT family N-acetyltransferase n=1 Tax=Treponema sp. HNW TaxID=3116654 RepID=UPI003D0A6AB5
MYIQPKHIELSNGKTAVFKSPEPADAAAVLECMRLSASQTYFLLRYPEEIVLTVEDEKKRLDDINNSENGFMLAAFIDGELVGNAGVLCKADCIKTRHRGDFGMGIKKAFWGFGLGTRMLSEAILAAKQTRLEQIELGVFADNSRALHMYKKAGFVQTGIIPRAYKLKDGTYRDEIQMLLKLSN